MLAYVFPGQGSLRPGVGAPWAHTPSWAVVDTLSEIAGMDLGVLLLDTDAPSLVQTRNAQAATFALSLVVLDHLRRVGLEPDAVAGHSLGEYSALVAAGALDETAGMELVAKRGEAMQTASEANPGVMAAVLGAEPDAVSDACAEIAGDVWIANDNAPGQVVVAGSQAAVSAVEPAVRARGASRVMPLAVGGAFHTPLMSIAQAPLEGALAIAPFRAATVPVVTNVDAATHLPGEAPWPSLLSAQLCQPVRWRQSLLRLAELGITTFVEVGPGEALCGMVRRTVPEATRCATNTPEATDELASALGGAG